jgi:hypothetical protein
MPALPILLTIIFVILQLTGVIVWSWWWVLSPLWIGAILGILLLALVGKFVKDAMNLDFWRK